MCKNSAQDYYSDSGQVGLNFCPQQLPNFQRHFPGFPEEWSPTLGASCCSWLGQCFKCPKLAVTSNEQTYDDTNTTTVLAWTATNDPLRQAQNDRNDQATLNSWTECQFFHCAWSEQHHNLCNATDINSTGLTYITFKFICCVWPVQKLNGDLSSVALCAPSAERCRWWPPKKQSLTRKNT